MAQRSTPDGWVSPADAPTNVRVTVVPGPRANPTRGGGAAVRSGAGLPFVVASIVLLLAAGAILAVAVRGGRPVTAAATRHAQPVPAGGAVALRRAQPIRADGAAAVPLTEAGTSRVAAIAAAYRYPLGCLGITLSATRSAMLGRRSPCWRYGVYVTAVLRRVNGVWRLKLEATSPRCPAVALPQMVRSALISCERAAAPPPSG
jgi:hypothetical protein